MWLDNPIMDDLDDELLENAQNARPKKRESNVVMFWSKYDNEENLEEWLQKEIRLNEFHKFTLLSQLLNNDDVFLYTYQKITNVPATLLKKVNVEWAGKIFDEESAFRSLQMGHSIAHISDIVRIRASTLLNGIITDMDMVSLRPLPEKEFFFTTIPAKQTGAMAIQFKENNPPFVIHDNSWNGKALSNFPTKVGESMSYVFLQLANKIENQLAKPPTTSSKAWNYIMWSLKDISNSLDESYVYPPLYFGPIPAWKGANKCYSLDYPTKFDGKTELFGYKLPSIESILQNSFYVAHYFESAFKGSGEYQNIWDNVKSGSLLHAELNYFLGYDWKNILNGH